MDVLVTTPGLAAIALKLPPPASRIACVDRISDKQEEIWKIGEYHFAAARLGRLKNHLADGGMAWMGTTSPELNTSLVAKQGPGNHGRSTKEGCELSTIPTGEGGGGLTQTANLLKRGFTARTTVDQGALPNFRYYKIIKKDDTAAQSDDADDGRDIGAPLTDLVTIVRGPSWFGLVLFYCAKVHGAMSFKIPGVILVLA